MERLVTDLPRETDHDEREWQLFLQEAEPALAALRLLSRRFESRTVRSYFSQCAEEIRSLAGWDD